MKRVVSIAAAVVFVLLLAACGGAQPVEENTQTPPNQTAPEYPDLPQLTLGQFVASSHSQVLPPVQALQLTTSWAWDCGRAVNFDSPHPLQMQPSAFEDATLPMTAAIGLYFSYMPQEIVVRRWPAEFLLLEQDEIPFGDYEIVEFIEAGRFFSVREGGVYIYEVSAQWENGNRSSYAFQTGVF
jgi:hypothetical protein